MKVKVSVVMAVFNEEKFLMEAIESVQAQTEENWELVIVDDHSSDNSSAIAEKVSLTDERVVTILNPGKGKVDAFNAAVGRASGQYLHLFAGDDVLVPSCLEDCLRRIVETGTTAIYHELQRVDANLNPLPDQLCGDALSRHSLDQALTQFSYAIPSGLWFFEKEAHGKAWPIPDHVPYEDVWVSICFLSRGSVGYLGERLYLYRQHENQTYGQASDTSLETYKFRMARLGKSFASVFGDDELRINMEDETKQFCKEQILFAELLCGSSHSLFRLAWADLPFKRKVSIGVAWYMPWIWSRLREKALGIVNRG